MQKFWIDKMIERIVRGALGNVCVWDLRGTKVSRAGIGLTEIIVGSIAVMEDISPEIGVRVKNFIRGDRRHGGRLISLRVRVDPDDQVQTVRNPPIRLSAICTSPVELPYVNILLNESFTKAL
ncbi:hypothetical protein TNCV_5126541 [Trichonephila clavipes]|nr:hypothetical protein TNCV_5126541 [Trichonephila clavipes]